MGKKEKKIIQTTTQEFLELLDIDGTFDIVEKDDEDTIDIVLNTKDSGIVIGYHGDTLESLQLVLSLCIAKELGKFRQVSVEVGDYKKNRIDWLKNLAMATKERVAMEKKEIALPELKPWERKVIHITLENDKEVVSGSQGEGRDRVLLVKPR